MPCHIRVKTTVAIRALSNENIVDIHLRVMIHTLELDERMA